MFERGFVEALKATIERNWPCAAIVRSVDRFKMGIPDLMAWIPLKGEGERLYTRPEDAPRPWSLAIEAKQLNPLMPDALHRGRRTGLLLKHPFTGPQISMLRELKRAGVDAFGLVRASADTAFRIEPEQIPAKTGNFTHEEIVELGAIITRRAHGWVFWRE